VGSKNGGFDMGRLAGAVRLLSQSLTGIVLCTIWNAGCANTETTEEECDSYLRSLAYFASVEPTGSVSAKAKDDGLVFSSLMFLYCREQIPPQDPLDRATGINIF
jgi:hypothetical protein